MPTYTICIPRYEIKRTRSRHEDTNYVTAALSVNNVPIGPPKTRFMGDQNDGTYELGFRWPDVHVPDGSTVVLYYQIMNLGHKNHAEVEAALTGLADQQLRSDAPAPDWKLMLLNLLSKLGLSLVFANCDGPIAPPQGRKIIWSSWELAEVAPGTTSSALMDERGNDSPSGCGANSRYIVEYTVSR